MSLLRPVLATVSVLVLAACAAGSTTASKTEPKISNGDVRATSGVDYDKPCILVACTPEEQERWDNKIRGDVLTIKPCIIVECTRDEQKRWDNRERANYAGVEPAAAIDLYEPFGIPIEDNGPMPEGIERRRIALLRENVPYDGTYPPFTPPVPSSYFSGVVVNVGLNAKIGSVEGRSQPLPREECIRRLEEIVSYWRHAYPDEKIMRHPGRQPERHYMVPMLDTRQSNAYAWCGLANDWDEYELWVSFISRAGANPRDYWRSIAEWPHLR